MVHSDSATIRCLRICGLHMSRDQFAEAAGFGPHTVKQWEQPPGSSWTSRPSGAALPSLARLAKESGWHGRSESCTTICRMITRNGDQTAESTEQPDPD